MGYRTLDDLLNGSIVAGNLTAAGQQLQHALAVSTSVFNLLEGFHFIHSCAFGFQWGDPKMPGQFVPFTQSKALNNTTATFS